MTEKDTKKAYLKAKSDGKIYSFEYDNMEFAKDDMVLFESDVCQEVGTIIPAEEIKNYAVDSKGPDSVVIIRKLSEKDMAENDRRQAEGRTFLSPCREVIEKHSLPMELLDTDLSFDGKKLTFYFSAPSRVDFRSLVSELATKFQKLIRLQQVGTRDRARCVGGVGRCGEQFCCKRFLKGELECVTIDMAYDQNLGSMGANRSTGGCGKLMCCLRYELDFYKERKKSMPPQGKEISTPKGKGIVINQNILQNKVTVQFPDKTYLEVDC